MAVFPRRLRVECLENRRLLTGLPSQERLDVCRGLELNDTPTSTVAVTAADLRGLRSAEVQLAFTPRDFDSVSASVKAGAAWQGKASVVSKINEEAGTIDVFLFAANPIATSAGELLEIEVDYLDQLAHDVHSHFELNQFELNEGKIRSTPQLQVRSGFTEYSTDRSTAQSLPENPVPLLIGPVLV